MADRGRIGSMPAATERDDESYLDFVQGLRSYTIGPLTHAAERRATDAMARFEAATGRPAGSMEEVRRVIDRVPIIAALNRLMRTSQEMMWQGVIATYRKRQDALIAELDRADRSGPGAVWWDPHFQLPAYFTAQEYHIQPGSYHNDPLAGYIYHYGTKVFFTGRNDHDEMHQAMVDSLPLPADGIVRRILDIACSVGQATTALKNVFPRRRYGGSRRRRRWCATPTSALSISGSRSIASRRSPKRPAFLTMRSISPTAFSSSTRCRSRSVSRSPASCAACCGPAASSPFTTSRTGS
ncbi:MAG: hypothetical protein RMM58_12085 [Chloroflexota bacterium]|nr:hypothetical protein [Dehalococcoidia bacterium]MDW8254606.1 hypothetical protein [Chloroflexota bacterium]